MKNHMQETCSPSNDARLYFVMLNTDIIKNIATRIFLSFLVIFFHIPFIKGNRIYMPARIYINQKWLYILSFRNLERNVNILYPLPLKTKNKAEKKTKGGS